MMKGDGSNASRITAATAILDRTLGKAGQPVKAKPPRKPAPTRIEWVFVDPKDVPGHPAHAETEGDR